MAGSLNAKLAVDGTPLDPSEVTLCRAVVARGNYVFAGRPGISFAVKEAARDMASPTKESWDNRFGGLQHIWLQGRDIDGGSNTRTLPGN